MLQQPCLFEHALQHVHLVLREDAFWIRVEILDSKTKTLTVNGAAYVVFYSASPNVYIANLRPRHADYILHVSVLLLMPSSAKSCFPISIDTSSLQASGRVVRMGSLYFHAGDCKW